MPEGSQPIISATRCVIAPRTTAPDRSRQKKTAVRLISGGGFKISQLAYSVTRPASPCQSTQIDNKRTRSRFPGSSSSCAKAYTRSPAGAIDRNVSSAHLKGSARTASETPIPLSNFPPRPHDFDHRVALTNRARPQSAARTALGPSYPPRHRRSTAPLPPPPHLSPK